MRPKSRTKSKSKNYLAVIVFLLMAAAYKLLVPAEEAKKVTTSSGTDFLAVTKVVDGDTFWVEDEHGERLKVRLIGVDTPETVHPNKPVEYFGREASDYAKMLLKGNRVRLEYDVAETDRYGRKLAYVYLEDGTFLNAKLIEEGYARVMTVPPNVSHSEEFLELQRKAREESRGLWKGE